MRGKAAARCFGAAPLFVLLSLLATSFAADSKERQLFKRDSKSSHSWNYEDKTGPAHWPEMFKKCGGSRQSPVDIDIDNVDENDELDEFDFENYEDDLDGAYIENNGHTVVVYPGAKDEPRTFTEGGMDDTFQFVQLHFHWGGDSKRGSEHTIEGKKYPLEMHLVHRNTKYKSMEAASQWEDGIAVLAVLFKVDDEDNNDLEPIIDKLDDVRKEGTKADLDDFDLLSLLPDDLMPFYRYEGSLTTPACNEVVTWTVFKNFAEISEKQLQMFRGVKESDAGEEDENLVDNFRPVQPLHGRIIEISGMGAASAITVSGATILMALAFLAVRQNA